MEDVRKVLGVCP